MADVTVDLEAEVAEPLEALGEPERRDVTGRFGERLASVRRRRHDVHARGGIGGERLRTVA